MSHRGNIAAIQRAEIPVRRIRVAGAYYDFSNISGTRNAFNSNLLDYTAPLFAQKGNTLFDIRNALDPDAPNLLALQA